MTATPHNAPRISASEPVPVDVHFRAPCVQPGAPTQRAHAPQCAFFRNRRQAPKYLRNAVLVTPIHGTDDCTLNYP